MSRAVDRAAALLHYAGQHPAGFDYLEACAAFGMTRDQFYQSVRIIRQAVARKGVEAALVCEPAGQAAPWIYRLVGTLEDARGWATNRTGDLETRLATMAGVAQTLASVTDARTRDGRKARLMTRYLDRLVEDLTDLDASIRR